MSWATFFWVNKIVSSGKNGEKPFIIYTANEVYNRPEKHY